MLQPIHQVFASIHNEACDHVVRYEHTYPNMREAMHPNGSLNVYEVKC